LISQILGAVSTRSVFRQILK